MKFGIFVPLQLPRPWAEDDEGTLLAEALEQVELADRIGVHAVWAQEHHFLEEYSHSSAPEVFLGACSQRTRRIRLGHGISVASPRFNHPARVAERVATLDLLSGGRVEWGTGESGSRMELEGFGVPFVDKRAAWLEGVREAARMMSSDPYPGTEGRFVSMPCRNVVPKPKQRPHPPLWAACSNRDSLALAARLGMGALTFAFADAEEARFWVRSYHEAFEREATPLTRAVNPQVAMLTGFLCHEDDPTADRLGAEGAQFFAYGLGHFWRDGSHVPGRTDLWQSFRERPASAAACAERDRYKAGMGGIGSPERLRERFRTLEAAGVDQLILLHQCGKYRHEDICASLELFGRTVLPEFLERDEREEARRRAALAPHVEAALARAPAPPDLLNPPPVDAYPRLWAAGGASASSVAPDRRPGTAALWQLQVGGARRRQDADPGAAARGAP